MKVIAIDVPELGNRSYVVHDGEAAAVVDPCRRVNEIVDRATDSGVSIQAVLETHIHNDYMTGGYALAKKLDVPYYLPEDEAGLGREPVHHEDVIQIGKLRITALASPGHTYSHMSYLVEQTGEMPAVFSGGSLLHGGVGWPDLVPAEEAWPLAKFQYQTAQFFAETLRPETAIYPTHGFGGFYGTGVVSSGAVSTLGQQLEINRAYATRDEDEFAQELIDSLGIYPAYFTQMRPINLVGPLEAQLNAPVELSRKAVMKALHHGAAIIDMRSRRAFAAGHLPGSYNIELDHAPATHIGWLVSWDAPLILVAKSADEVRTAQERLALIGREAVAGQVRPEELLDGAEVKKYPVATFKDLAAHRGDENMMLLDVRHGREWQGGHIEGAKHIPLHELAGRLRELPFDERIWVYSYSGHRASIAASILSSTGRYPVLLDDRLSNAAALDSSADQTADESG